MTTTVVDMHRLLSDVNDATRLLQRSKTIPVEVAELIDNFGSVLDASQLRREADPYLTAALWEAAYHAEKSLHQDTAIDQRRDVRIALEQFRLALRDVTENQPYSEEVPARDVLSKTVEILAAPQKDLSQLLGVSVRQLQRWLAEDGSEPAADDAARIRVMGRVVNQLRHTFTGPGVLAWFNREHPVLSRRPIELLDDPLHYPEILSAATASRAMTA